MAGPNPPDHVPCSAYQDDPTSRLRETTTAERLAGTVLRLDDPGRLLDTFVAAQLRAELAACSSRPRLYHLRTEAGRQEVDLLPELGRAQSARCRGQGVRQCGHAVSSPPDLAARRVG